MAIAFVCGGLALFLNAFSPALRGKIAHRVTSAGFGVMAMEVGILRYAEISRLPWATPELRGTVFVWVCGVVVVCMFAAWVIQLRVEKRKHDTKG